VSFPKIIYTPAGGAEQTLQFHAPARFIPGYSRTAVRHDNIATAGIRESVLERIDDLLEIAVEFVFTADVAYWQGFFDHALTGAAFAYYPDAAVSSFTNYLFEDTDARLEYVSAGRYQVKLKMRKMIV